jgi:hypothetical protein
LVCGVRLVLLQISGALATVLVGKRKTSPTTETKPGKAPKVRQRKQQQHQQQPQQHSQARRQR